MNNSELVCIRGGFSSINTTIINTLTRFGTFLYSLGRTFGSAIRRATSGNICQ